MLNIYKNTIIVLVFLALAAPEPLKKADEITTDAECVKFDEKRFAWLKEVAYNGDVKGKETLKPSEYATMKTQHCNTKFTQEIVDKFQDTLNSLAGKQTRFIAEHEEIQEAINKNERDHFLEKVQADVLQEENGARKTHAALVIAAKKFLMDIFSAEGEAARIDVLAFMVLPEWKAMKVAFALSKIQSAALDLLINEDIWHEHLANRHHQKMEAFDMRRAVIAGAGPVGLLAAFQLFRAGMDIALVNDRVDYTRPQMVIYDSNWICTLRYLLGTTFDHIFYSPGLISAERGFIGIRFVEQALKGRLEDLAKFVQEKKTVAAAAAATTTADESEDEKSSPPIGCLDCLKKMVPKKGEKNSGVKRNQAGINEIKNAGGELKLFYGFAVAGLSTKLMDKNYYAKLKKGKVESKIAADLFLCAGGAGDKLREKLLGSSPVPRTKTVNYTTGIFKKVNQGRQINIHDVGKKESTRISVNMESMRKHLESAKFDKLIEDNIKLLPEKVHNHFNKDFTHQLLTMEDKNEFVFIENWEWFSLSAKTPTKMDELFQVIESQIQANAEKKEELMEFGRRIRWKWCEAAFNYAYYAEVGPTGRRANRSAEQFRVNIDANGDARIPTVADGPSLNIDRTGTRSFNVTVQTMKNVAKRKRQLGKRSVVVSAIGDALANTHFYTGSGMSIGRKGVEFFVKSVKKIISGVIRNQKEFVKNLTLDLKNVAEDTVKMAKKSVPHLVLSYP